MSNQVKKAPAANLHDELLESVNWLLEIVAMNADVLANAGEHPDKINAAIDRAVQAVAKGRGWTTEKVNAAILKAGEPGESHE